MGKKLKLDKIKIQSFVTTEEQSKINGGEYETYRPRFCNGEIDPDPSGDPAFCNTNDTNCTVIGNGCITNASFCQCQTDLPAECPTDFPAYC